MAFKPEVVAASIQTAIGRMRAGDLLTQQFVIDVEAAGNEGRPAAFSSIMASGGLVIGRR